MMKPTQFLLTFTCASLAMIGVGSARDAHPDPVAASPLKVEVDWPAFMGRHDRPGNQSLGMVVDPLQPNIASRRSRGPTQVFTNTPTGSSRIDGPAHPTPPPVCPGARG